MRIAGDADTSLRIKENHERKGLRKRRKRSFRAAKVELQHAQSSVEADSPVVNAALSH